MSCRAGAKRVEAKGVFVGAEVVRGPHWSFGDQDGIIIKGIGSVYKRHPVTKFEHGSHGASKRKFNHMTVY